MPLITLFIQTLIVHQWPHKKGVFKENEERNLERAHRGLLHVEKSKTFAIKGKDPRILFEEYAFTSYLKQEKYRTYFLTEIRILGWDQLFYTTNDYF